MGKLIVECKQYSYTDKSVARRLGVHPNTVRNAMKAGQRHHLYSRIIKVIKESK
jgi:transposase-like protein